jgi:hypothetical protein
MYAGRVEVNALGLNSGGGANRHCADEAQSDDRFYQGSHDAFLLLLAGTDNAQ